MRSIAVQVTPEEIEAIPTIELLEKSKYPFEVLSSQA